MDNAKHWFGYDSAAFFGRVNASISHELKNVMAIISETAGLLGDLSDMAASGTPVAPDMLKDCTGSIMEEIQRGFLIIRQMNRFSHSIDAPAASVNLFDVIDLAINLTGYLSFAGRTLLNRQEDVKPTALTCPFLLQAIIYQALVYTFKTTGTEAEVDISVDQRNDSTWRIIFSGFSLDGFHNFPDPVTAGMATSIGVDIRCQSTDDWLEMRVPVALNTDLEPALTAHAKVVGDARSTRP